jgi:predicted ATPase with chaperone activity
VTTTAAPGRQFIAEPVTVAELGLDRGMVVDLTLKAMFYRGRMTRSELSGSLKISGSAMQEVMQDLTQDGLATVLGSEANSPSGYVYALTQKGRDRADAAFNRTGYVGPAPVPLAEYIAQIRAQTTGEVTVTREQVFEALRGLTLADETVARIGRAASSRKSTLIYGPSGNGKTTVAHAIGAAIGGTIQIPYAIEMVGQLVHLFDTSKHEIVEGPDGPGGLMEARADRRWVRIKRPTIWAGGELTRHSLELMYDDNTRVYEAPLQLKANGGTLVIDDFGRQQIPAVQLLNRWIVALEGGVDHLTLHTGQTIEVPFDMLVLFSTNLPPERLADEAFLRRIRYKVELPNPTRGEFRTIFRGECAARSLPYNDGAVGHLLANWYDGHQRELRGCHPRDLVEAVIDAAQYDHRAPEITTATLDEACTTYFLRPADPPA